MAILPESNINLSKGVLFQNYPSLTFYVDPVSRRITGTCDGSQAVRQTVEIILNTERFQWQIYTVNFGMQWKGLIGQESAYIAAELQRRIRDAFSIDSRITGISDFTYSTEKDKLTASFIVRTVYGEIEQRIEVSLD